jgi:hypothetical protein
MKMEGTFETALEQDSGKIPDTAEHYKLNK